MDDLEGIVNALHLHKGLHIVNRLTVGVFLCVLLRTMSRKSVAVGTGAMAFIPLAADILAEK